MPLHMRGVSRIVKISAHGAHPDSPVAFWRGHAAVEEHLRRSGMSFMALRPMFSMANVLGHADGVRRQGVVFAPAVQAPIAMVDPQDVADVAARLLTTDRLPGGSHHLDVSGPAGVTFTDLAEVISRLTGRTVTYHPGTDQETVAYLEQSGTPPFVTTADPGDLHRLAVRRTGTARPHRHRHPPARAQDADRVLGRPHRRVPGGVVTRGDERRRG